MEKLKKHWEIKSNLQLVLIIFVFAINGSLSAFVTRSFFTLIHQTKENVSPFLYWFVYFISISIFYFLLLAITSRIFGKNTFPFFKKFAKKSLKPLGLSRFVL
jgi:hypothetical protein